MLEDQEKNSLQKAMIIQQNFKRFDDKLSVGKWRGQENGEEGCPEKGRGMCWKFKM